MNTPLIDFLLRFREREQENARENALAAHGASSAQQGFVHYARFVETHAVPTKNARTDPSDSAPQR